MYASVIPAIHSIRGVDIFTYALPVGHIFQRGTVVWIPWRNRKIIGVVWKTTAVQPDFAVKTIIQSTAIVLPEDYCQFIMWFAEYYHVSLSYTVKMIVPTIIRRRTTVSPFLALSGQTESLHIAKKLLPAIQNLTLQIAGPLPQPLTVLYRALGEPASIIMGILKHSKNQSMAILVPEEYLAILLAKICQTISSPVVVTSRLNGTQLLQSWLAMLQKTQRLFIGTKRLSLFPLHQVDTIIILDPEDPNQKQWDLNPRYHTSTISEYFWKHHGTKLIRFSQSPTVRQVQQNSIDTSLVDQNILPNVTIIDLNNSYDGSTHGLLSPSVLAECEQLKTTVLWLNKKGSGKLLYCLDCHAIEKNILHTRCQACHGSRLVKRGHGTTSLVEALRRTFPNRLIYECTKDVGYTEIDYYQKPIIVATNYALPFIHWQQVEYTAVISIDQVLAEPYFRASEQALHQLVKLRNFTGQLAVQTYAPEHPLWQALTRHYPVEWYASELHVRKQQHLPPFGQAITAIHKITKQEQPITTFDSPLWQDTKYMIDREE